MHTIQATNFYQYTKCPRKVYLHFFGDPEKKNPLSDFMKMKMEKGIEHEKNIVSTLKFVRPEEETPKEEAFKQTLNFIKQGADLIYQGVLLEDNLVGIPDLLEKINVKSNLGDYSYQVGDIKLGLSAKKEYIMQVCFYSYLLSRIQGMMPEKGFLILGNGEREEFKIQGHINQFAGIFKRIKEIALGAKEPVHICSTCKECIWHDFCLELAEQAKDLSLISNLPRQKIELFKRMGIKNLEDASKMDIEILSKVKGFSSDLLKRCMLQAESILTKKPILLEKPKFEKPRTEIYFDVEDTESEDGDKIVYLFGMVIDGEYTFLLAKKPKQEKDAWKKFLKFFETLEDFKIYHYSHHEKTMLKKLFERYQGDKMIYKKIIENMVDLLPVLKKSAVLPVYSYSIKNIAKYLGFRWSSEQASGSQSILWYEKWLETKNKKVLQELLRYNEEDCKAMEIIKKWLE